MLPERIPTGVRATTIPNPAILHETTPGATVFQGSSAKYNFKRQTGNYDALRKVLLANGTDFGVIAASEAPGDLHMNHRFVVRSKNGKLLWNKYVAYVAQGGQNHVYVAGMRIKVSVFLKLKPKQQAVLLTGDQALIKKAFSPDTLKYVNEADSLWN